MHTEAQLMDESLHIPKSLTQILFWLSRYWKLQPVQKFLSREITLQKISLIFTGIKHLPLTGTKVSLHKSQYRLSADFRHPDNCKS